MNKEIDPNKKTLISNFTHPRLLIKTSLNELLLVTYMNEATMPQKMALNLE